MLGVLKAQSTVPSALQTQEKGYYYNYLKSFICTFIQASISLQGAPVCS